MAPVEHSPSSETLHDVDSQCAALQFQINLHFLFLHDCLQLRGPPGILDKKKEIKSVSLFFLNTKYPV